MNTVYIALEVTAEGDVPGEDMVDRINNAIAALQMVGITITTVDVQDWWA